MGEAMKSVAQEFSSARQEGTVISSQEYQFQMFIFNGQRA